MELNQKTQPWYIGPMQVTERLSTGGYLVQELDGSQYKKKIAPFRILPYIQRNYRALQQLLPDNGEQVSVDDVMTVGDDESDASASTDENNEI